MFGPKHTLPLKSALAMCASLSALIVAGAAQAQTQAQTSVDEIVVTGTRIRNAETPAPTVTVSAETIADRGYVSVSQVINQITSSVPTRNVGRNDGLTSGSGQQFPNLFGLGAGRTLTLVNGRRFVTSGSGVSETSVDANVLPTGLIESVSVVQAGGAVVYGSDAIAGVVNYRLRKNFSGVVLDAQTGISSRDDYPERSLRGTAGTNFADGRGNVAINAEWSKTNPLRAADRPLSSLSRQLVANSTDTGPADGRSSQREVLDARFTSFNTNGVIFTTPAPVPLPPCGNQICFARNTAGQPLQFGADGSLIAYDPGVVAGTPFSSGGQGFRFGDLQGLLTGVERQSVNVIGHYDLTDRVTISTELLSARTIGTEIVRYPGRTVLNNDASGSGIFAFTRNNAFLTPATIATLTAASPSFAGGAPLFLSKLFPDLLVSDQQHTRTSTRRALLAIDGELGREKGDLYWSVSASVGEVEGARRFWAADNAKLNRALDAVRNAAGQIVCGVNADVSTANDDAGCVPLNPFGAGNISPAARAYVNVPIGIDYLNRQADLLASLGGNLYRLPAGDLSFSASYEHRRERAKFDPLQANKLGLFGAGSREVSQAGRYSTNEVSLEMIAPIFGGDFTLPGVQSLKASGAFRYVDNSLAGKEKLWSAGLEWKIIDDVTLRASRSRNFRAPSLSQLLAPSSQALGAILSDPCDADRINAGPNPAVRRSNCLALFTANAGYGVLADGSNAGATPAARLAVFQDPAENFTRTLVTTGGNNALRNEISKTWTYGVLLNPRLVPGLRITADRIEIDLTDGLSAFTTQDFAAACYDNPTPPTGVCTAFTRLAAANGSDPGGTIVSGTTTTFNAGVVQYRGEVYALNYGFNVGPVLGEWSRGRFSINAEATHTALLRTSVTGQTFVRTDDTVNQSDWSGRLDLGYDAGPVRLSYQMQYLDDVLIGANATVETDPTPFVKRNVIHSLSTQVRFGDFAVRAGVTNLFDKGPSYPALSYGDVLGRRYYAGVTARF